MRIIISKTKRRISENLAGELTGKKRRERVRRRKTEPTEQIIIKNYHV